MTINAGDLRNLATFTAPTVLTEDGDVTLEPFVEDFQAWVQIQPMSGSEEIVGDQVQTSRTHLVTARFDSRIMERMQMTARNRKFEILSVLNIDERDVEMQLACKELL